ncbi:hypothetical protein ACC691_39630, partial [Rhizobium johnstonii]|uniref:hypothetical protein n=1 Tax=Rhizobium johnstonii TaxID=3019933 RepID=UPI003F945746
YGKSTLLYEWASLETRRVAWVTLDHLDDDPVALLTLLAAAHLRSVGGDPALIDDMRGHGFSSLGRTAPRLASALRGSVEPFVLMLD